MLLCIVMASSLCVQLVEGGHRAIIFSRVGGVQPDIYREGLHFRCCFFIDVIWAFCIFDVFLVRVLGSL